MLRSGDGDAWGVLVRSADSMLIATGSYGRGQKEPRVEGR